MDVRLLEDLLEAHHSRRTVVARTPHGSYTCDITSVTEEGDLVVLGLTERSPRNPAPHVNKQDYRERVAQALAEAHEVPLEVIAPATPISSMAQDVIDGADEARRSELVSRLTVRDASDKFGKAVDVSWPAGERWRVADETDEGVLLRLDRLS